MLIDGLRPLWLPSIAAITGPTTGRISEWVHSGQYYFDSPVGPDTASFVCTPGQTLTEIFAAEMSRFSSAAIETSVGITRPSRPKSTAWLFIQNYYAAFYSAHCILRSAGISASNFGNGECQKVDQISTILGFSNKSLNAGQFRCEYLAASDRLECTSAKGRGIHEQFWRIFDTFIEKAGDQALHNPALPTSDAQDIFSRLNDLRSILSSNGQAGGQWLSTIRNEITYKHQHEAWFPYGRTRANCDRLFMLQKDWLKEPDDIVFNSLGTAEVENFVLACAFLVSLSIAVVKDMSIRCPLGRSFLLYGPLELLSQASA
jgi:hypothetical protein